MGVSVAEAQRDTITVRLADGRTVTATALARVSRVHPEVAMIPLLLACVSVPKESGGPTESETETEACPVFLVSPEVLTWDLVQVETTSTAAVSVVNSCVGDGALSVLAEIAEPGFTVTGGPLSLEPGGAATLEVQVTPETYAALSGTLLLTTNDPAPPTVAIPLTASIDPDADEDGHDAASAGGDDCDDADPAAFPGAPDAWYDGVDSDCDGASDYDQDHDGHDAAAEGGDDCEDTDPARSPSALEVWYDGVDSDCDGASDYDQDRDGHDAAAEGGDDCDDLLADVYPGAPEVWYDGVDGDCDGSGDFDQDGDGFELGADCDDEDATVAPGAVDAWYDGVDADCDGASDFDQDGDGFDLGLDCVDTDPAVHPAAAEIWYDGADTDCDGASDFDQDRDGDDRYPEGADCNDLDPTTIDGEEETLNGLDDDCDGSVDEGLAAPGDVLVTEIHADPSAVSDTFGEWFEVYNTTGLTIDLNGWNVYSDDGGLFVISGSVPVPPYGYALLGVNGDPALNGGVAVDYVYDRATFSMGDSGDSIYLRAGGVEVSSVVWNASWPGAVYVGSAQQLDPSHYTEADVTRSVNWCVATTAFGAGDDGTPGSANLECSALDDDGDGQDDFDCDDNDADVRPGAVDVAGDGVDQDCDGFADNPVLAEGSLPTVRGGATGAGILVLGVGDTDGDGPVEVVVANDTGTVYLLEAAPYAGWSGSVSTIAEASVRLSAAGATNLLTNGVGDYTGDGITDVLLVTTSGADGLKGPFIGAGGSRASDVTFNVRAATGATGPSVWLGADFDGDGVDDPVWADPHTANSARGLGFVQIFSGGPGLSGVLTGRDATTTLVVSEDVALGASLAFGDVDGDGLDDLAATTAQSGSPGGTYIWASDGLVAASVDLGVDGHTFVETKGTYDTLSSLSMALGDFDADGATDFAFSWQEGVWEGGANLYLALPGGGAAVDVPDVEATGFQFPGSMADVDGDGFAELAITGVPSYTDPLFHGFLATYALADGTIDPDDAAWGVGVYEPSSPTFLIADLDADGHIELLTGDAYTDPTRTDEGSFQVVPGP
jgi:hypothetical protein